MTKFYTVDRRLSLKEGQIITLKKYNDISPNILQTHADNIFPDGVSIHGEFYWLKSRPIKVNEILELVFEYVRQSQFMERPSRFQSLFANKTIEQSKSFKMSFCNSIGDIWELECENYFRADMKLLTIPNSLLLLSYFAHQYWQGYSKDSEPNWECLLSPPIKVIRRIK